MLSASNCHSINFHQQCSPAKNEPEINAKSIEFLSNRAQLHVITMLTLNQINIRDDVAST